MGRVTRVLKRRVDIDAALFLLLGAIAAWLGEGSGWWRHTLRIVSEPVMIASLLAILWHVREFRELFTRHAQEVLLEKPFIGQLSPATLRSWREKAAECIVSPHLQGDAWRDYHSWMENLIFENGLLQKGAGGEIGGWRENYREQLTIRIRSVETSLDEWHRVGLLTEAEWFALRDQLTTRGIQQHLMADIQSTAEFAAVLPGDANWPVQFRWWTADQDALDWEKLVIFSFAVGGWPKHRRLDLKASDHPNGGTEVKGRTTVPLTMGATTITIHSRFLQSAVNEPYVIGLMPGRTRGMQVNVSVESPAGHEVTLDGQVFGLGGNVPNRTHKTLITLEATGWLLEDHGYLVYWFPAEGVLGRT